MSSSSPTQVADGVYVVNGTDVSVVLVTDGDAVTVVDTGYPGDASTVLAALTALGRTPGDVTGIILTHAHIDHIGGAAQLAQVTGAPVSISAAELPDAASGPAHQLTAVGLAPHLWRPRYARWTLRILRVGATRFTPVPGARALPDAGPTGPARLDLPGAPRVIPTPGHTRGHVSFHLPERGVLIAGDALCTGHAITGPTGPRLLPRLFQEDDDLAARSLATLAPLDAGVLICGHGPTAQTSPAAACAEALAHR